MRLVTEAPSTFAEIEDLSHILTRTFQTVAGADWWPQWLSDVGRENLVCARRGDHVVGGFGVFRTAQCFGGRAQDAAGVAAVGVRPEERGTGVGRTLMEAHLQDTHQRGTALSILYPATVRFYRRFGYELAGCRAQYRLRTGDLDHGERVLPALGVDIDGDDQPPAPIAEVHRQTRNQPGTLVRSPGLWGRLLRSRGLPVNAIVVGPRNAPEGYIVWTSSEGRIAMVREAVALTLEANRRILTLLHDLRTLDEFVVWPGPVQDLRLAELPHRSEKLQIEQEKTWMLRIVRVAEALRGRGYPAAADGQSLCFEVSDPVLASNSGVWTLTVTDGRAEVTRSGEPEIALDISALAPLFSGQWSASELVDLGRIAIRNDEAVTRADRIFAGRRPYMVDLF